MLLFLYIPFLSVLFGFLSFIIFSLSFTNTSFTLHYSSLSRTYLFPQLYFSITVILLFLYLIFRRNLFGLLSFIPSSCFLSLIFLVITRFFTSFYFHGLGLEALLFLHTWNYVVSLSLSFLGYLFLVTTSILTNLKTSLRPSSFIIISILNLLFLSLLYHLPPSIPINLSLLSTFL